MQDVEDHPITDGGHTFLQCSACRALLMDIFSTRPSEPEKWTLRANCPFCMDKSWPVTVKGGFHYGGFAVAKPDDPTDDRPVTIVENFDIVGDQFHFLVKKAKPDSSPVFSRQ